MKKHDCTKRLLSEKDIDEKKEFIVGIIARINGKTYGTKRSIKFEDNDEISFEKENLHRVLDNTFEQVEKGEK